MNELDFYRYVKRVAKADKEAKIILSSHESSVNRSITIEDTLKNLKDLSIIQEDLFKQALRSIEHELFRSAIIMSWTAFIDFLHNKFSEDGFIKLNSTYPRWNISTMDDLRNVGNDYQLVEATGKVGICSKNDVKALHSLLSRRNECAHPSEYYPELNESLGYISEIIKRIKILKGRTII